MFYLLNSRKPAKPKNVQIRPSKSQQKQTCMFTQTCTSDFLSTNAIEDPLVTTAIRTDATFLALNRTPRVTKKRGSLLAAQKINKLNFLSL